MATAVTVVAAVMAVAAAPLTVMLNGASYDWVPGGNFAADLAINRE
jgi:hypothetical protein